MLLTLKRALLVAVCLSPLGATTAFAQHPGIENAWGAAVPANAYGVPGRPDAPLYPCPRSGIPIEVGATVITNPAFDPHEMLYPHTYKAIYPPYYYKVNPLNPLGWFHRYDRVGGPVPSYARVYGTRVRVKYRGDLPLFSGYNPPFH